MPKVGVVAIQGDFSKHVEALKRCEIPNLDVVELRTPGDLAGVERAIIPGGESTTVGLLMQRFGLGDALKEAAAAGMPIWGTCMGMIMMSREVESKPEQYTLGLLDIVVRRNAFGAQVHSFEDSVVMDGLAEPITGVFIRAPIVVDLGAAQGIAQYHGKTVAVRQGKLIGTSFHPELTDDIRLHKWFLEI